MAMRKASRTTAGMLAALAIWRDSLVSGLNALTTSTIWNRAWRLVWIAFCPVIITIGMAPSRAYAAPVVRFSAPGPKRSDAHARPSGQPADRSRP